MSTMDYDKEEPNYLPIIFAVIFTIIVIILMTVGLVYYFKGVLVQQETKNINQAGITIELDQIKEYENNYLYDENEDKITIDEAITIINNRYN